MRTLSSGLAAHIAAGTTTLCRCWRLARRDGVTLGFTDHDRALAFDGVIYEPDAGFTASEAPASMGLAVDTADVLGALGSGLLRQEDILAGRYDAAGVEVWLVNWCDVGQRLLQYAGSIGEITRQDGVFRAEVRGVSHVLEQPRGRIYSAMCDAELGDARCGASLTAPSRRATASVSALDGTRGLVITGADAIPDGQLAWGRLVWLSGANAGQASQIRMDGVTAAGRRIELWQAPALTVGVGDQAQVTLGCDRRFDTCRERFANAVNFRGCPQMPGQDFALSYARTSAS